MSARYLVNLEPRRVRSIARLLRRLAERCDQIQYGRMPETTIIRACKESENLLACADAAETLLEADVAKWGSRR